MPLFPRLIDIPAYKCGCVSPTLFTDTHAADVVVTDMVMSRDSMVKVEHAIVAREACEEGEGVG